jgi:hypothetical protein
MQSVHPGILIRSAKNVEVSLSAHFFKLIPIAEFISLVHSSQSSSHSHHSVCFYMTSIQYPTFSFPIMNAMKLFFTTVLLCSAASASKLRGVMSLPTRRRLAESSKAAKHHKEQCSENAACAALGLLDACCPTIDNVFLDCCGADASETDDKLPTAVEQQEISDFIVITTIKGSKKQNQDAACSENAACAALGLIDACCPTIDNVFLDCCGAEEAYVLPADDIEQQEITDLTETSEEETAEETKPAAACSENVACAALGLTGACCPTTDNVFLDCCGPFIMLLPMEKLETVDLTPSP